MLTPRFSLSQDNDYIIACISAPYVKFSDGEMCMQGNEFSFYCKPYHLRLYFSGDVVENGSESAEYSVDAGEFTIKIPKCTHGEVFSNLDMLTKLMTPPSNNVTVKASTLIQVLGNESDTSTEKHYCDEDEIDWSIEQVVEEKSISISVTSPKYGFNLTSSGVFDQRPEDRHELLDIDDPDTIPCAERSALQLQNEKQCFNDDHYIADLLEDDVIQEFITFPSTINSVYYTSCKEKKPIKELVKYSKEELESIIRLPRKEYLMDQSETRHALLGLVDILYAYHYDNRTTMEDSTVESAWTVRKLSGTLSWLVTYSDIRQVLTSSVRRAVSFPLYRHWILAMKVLDDVRITLAMGGKQILKCLLHVHQLFSNTESYHILNDLYITDYCVWVQTVSDKSLEAISTHIKGFSLSKVDLELGLPELEVEYLSAHSDPNRDVDSESDEDSEDHFDTDSDDDPSEDSAELEANACAEVTKVEQQLAQLSVGDGRTAQEDQTQKKSLIEVISSSNENGCD